MLKIVSLLIVGFRFVNKSFKIKKKIDDIYMECYNKEYVNFYRFLIYDKNVWTIGHLLVLIKCLK